MAIGFLECAGYGAVLYAMDKACKAADIRIIGIDTINPKDVTAFIPLTAQVKFEGRVDDVKEACEVAKRAALEINHPEEVLVEMIEKPYEGTKKLSGITKVAFAESNNGNHRRE
ncbi:BMC domain-containing protein [Lachnospiraceae bacterium 54-53]